MTVYFLLKLFLFVVTILVFSAIVSMLLIRHLKFFDVPNERFSHTKIRPRGGRMAIVTGFILGISLIQWGGDKSPIFTSYVWDS